MTDNNILKIEFVLDEHKKGQDLKKLERLLNEALAKETPKTLIKWLEEKNEYSRNCKRLFRKKPL